MAYRLAVTGISMIGEKIPMKIAATSIGRVLS